MLFNHAPLADGMERCAVELRRMRAPGAPIRIDFFSHNNAFWHSMASLIQECAQRAAFAPRVIIRPPLLPGEGDHQAETAWLQHRGLPWEQCARYTPDAASTDIFCCVVPYDSILGAGLDPLALMERGVLPVLIPYCTEWLGGRAFFRLYFGTRVPFWRTFVASRLSQKMYVENHHIPLRHLPIVGNPEYDLVPSQGEQADMPKFRRIREAARGRRVLLWTPHYAVDDHFCWGTWHTLGEAVVRLLALLNQQIFVVLRPHPALRPLLASAEPHSRALARLMDEAGNFFLDDQGQCLESLLACDALVSDCSSLMVKAMRLGKSVLHTWRTDGDGSAAMQDILRGHVHLTQDMRGVQRFVNMLLLGQDPLLPLPEAVADYLCGPADGHAAARVADHLEQHFFGSNA